MGNIAPVCRSKETQFDSQCESDNRTLSTRVNHITQLDDAAAKESDKRIIFFLTLRIKGGGVKYIEVFIMWFLIFSFIILFSVPVCGNHES